MSAQRTAALLPQIRGFNRRSRRALRSHLRRFSRRPGQSLRSWQREQLTVIPASGAEVYVHAVQYEYNETGHLKAVWNNTGAGLELYWRADAANLRGQVTQETLGNGVVTFREYDPVTGAVEGISSGEGNQNVQLLTIQWDLAGNVKQRVDERAGHQEDFLYDELYRLRQSSFVPLTTGAGSALETNYFYDAMGRFTNREDVGTYGYDNSLGGNPYAVRSVTAPAAATPYTYFCYDQNGNVTQQAGVSGCASSITRAFTWSAGNRLRTVTVGSVSSTFHYTASGARFRQAKADGAQTEATLYVGAYYERVTSTDGGTTTTKHRLYVRAGERVVAEEEILHTGVRETRYWHRDHLGSITAITTQDYNGGEYGEVGTTGFYGLYGFAAWGEPRDAITTVSNPANWLSPPPNGVYHRGYTGHEMLPDLGIIHMNGRVYMPEIGRFLSPDPFVQFPESTQNYNRYVYVGNNPLSYTDPSGYFLKDLMKVVGFVLNFVPGMQGISPFLRGFITGFLGSGGNLRGALLGGIGGAMFQGIGDKFGSPAFGSAHHLQKIIAHGLTGGMLSVAGGGRFGDGFLGAASAQLFAPAIDRIGMDAKGNISTNVSMRIARVAAAAVVGGTASALGGGKFAAGAITAAFARMYNDEAHIRQQTAREYAWERLASGQVRDDIADYGIGLAEGAGSIVKGTLYSVRHVARGMGVLGTDELRTWQMEAALADKAAYAYATDQTIRAAANNAAWDGAKSMFDSPRNIGRAIGRGAAAFAVRPLGVAAAIGDVTHAVSQGVRNSYDLARRTLWGH